MKFVAICKKCGYIVFDRGNGNIAEKKCLYCDEVMQPFPVDADSETKVATNRPNDEREMYRLQLQPLDQYDAAAWEHREKMDSSKKKSRDLWFPKNFDYKFKRGVAHPECPYCHSYFTEKVSKGKKAASVGLFGLASNKIGKQWYCCSCKSYF